MIRGRVTVALPRDLMAHRGPHKAKSPDRPDGLPLVCEPGRLRRFRKLSLVALLPTALAAVCFFGLRVLVVAAACCATVLAVEAIFARLRGRSLRGGGLSAGLLLALVLPPALPMGMVVAGAAFAAACKELFGGSDRCPFHPALLGRVFLTLNFPAAMSAAWIAPAAGWPGRLIRYVGPGAADAVTAATPLAQWGDGRAASLFDLFLGAVPGSAGETCAATILLGGLILIVLRAADWRTPLSMLATFALLAGGLHVADAERFAAPAWQLCAGGVLFGAVFLAIDPVSGPRTRGGKWICGALVGAVALLIRCFGGYRDGVSFAILLGSIVAPLVDAAFGAPSVRPEGEPVPAVTARPLSGRDAREGSQ